MTFLFVAAPWTAVAALVARRWYAFAHARRVTAAWLPALEYSIKITGNAGNVIGTPMLLETPPTGALVRSI